MQVIVNQQRDLPRIVINFNCLLNLVDVNAFINATEVEALNDPRLRPYEGFVRRASKIQ